MAAEPVTHTVTAGVGRTGAQGRSVPVPGGVEGLARWLNTRKPEGLDTWWSVHAFADGYRAVAPTRHGDTYRGGWISAAGVGVDMDYCGVPASDPRHRNAKGKSAHTHDPLPPELASRLEELAREGKLPGNLFHLTRRGFRLVFVFDVPCEELRAFQTAAKGATERVAAVLQELGLSGCPGLQVDTGASEGMGKVLWAPKGPVAGEDTPRDFSVLVMAPEPFAVTALRPAPPAPAPVRTSSGLPRTHTTADLDEAVERYNREHPRDLPRNSGTCPVCGFKGGFGELPGSPGRWSCWNTDHEGAGREPKEAGKPWTGDSLDLDAYEANTSRVAYLRASGYLAERPAPRRARPGAPAPRPAPAADERPPEDVQVDEEQPEPEEAPEPEEERNGPRTRPLFDTSIEEIFDRQIRAIEQGVPRIKTGWPLFDAKVGGIEIPSMTILGAAPKSGKSSWASHVAEYHASHGGLSYVLDIENGERRVLNRMLCRRARLNPALVDRALRDPGAAVFSSEAEAARWQAAKVELVRDLGGRYFVDTRPPDLERRLAEVKEQAGALPVLFVVDSLQRLPMDMSERRAGIDTWIDLLERLTKEYEIATLLISEIKRDASGGYKVGEAAFKESSRIEYAGDLLLTMARPSIDDEDPDEPALLRVEAARDNPLDPRGPVASYRPVFPHYGLDELRPTFASTSSVEAPGVGRPNAGKRGKGGES